MAGKIKKLLENELVGGTQSTDIYPITSIKAIYDEANKRLDTILSELEGKIPKDYVKSEEFSEVFTALQQTIVNEYFRKDSVTQKTGSSTTSVMSQDAVTKELAKKPGQHNEFGDYFNNSTVNSGQYNHAEGNGSRSGGDACHAEGIRTMAAESGSHSEGIETIANNTASHAEGYKTIANGKCAHAEGYKTTANGIYSHAEGANTQAGAQGHAEGNGSIAGDTCHAEGKNTISNGNFSHSEGDGTEATGDSSHSEGYRTKATGRQAHSEGNSTVASGHYSHAEGNSTVASGEFTHTEGYLTKATGKYSHSEGHSCSALGFSSHAEGDSNTASGDYSHAEGFYTEVAKFCGHVEGKYNQVTDSIHILGGGASDTDRKNLHEIKEDGSQYMIGIGGYNGKNRDTAKDLATVLNEGLPTNLIFVNRNFPTNNEQLTEDDKSLLYRLSSGTTTGIFFHNAYIVFPVSVNVSKYGGGGSIQYTIAISYIFDGYEETATASLTKNGLNTSYSENWSVVKKEFTSGGNETIQIPETVIYPSMGLTYFGSIFAEYVEPGTYIYNAKNNDNEREKSVGRLVVFKDTVINKTVQMLYDYKYSDDDPNNIIETTRKVRFVVSPQESGDWADF